MINESINPISRVSPSPSTERPNNIYGKEFSSIKHPVRNNILGNDENLVDGMPLNLMKPKGYLT